MKRTYTVAVVALAMAGGAVVVASATPSEKQAAQPARAAIYQPRSTVRVVTPAEAVRLKAESRARAGQAADVAAHVAIDPETGKKRQMSHEEWKALHGRDEVEATPQVAQARMEQLQPIALPGGAVAVELTDDFMSEVVAVRGPDGKVTHDCAPRGARAKAHAHTAPTTARGAEEM